MRRRSLVPTSLVPLLLLTAGACHHGGGSTPTQEFEVMDVEVSTAQPMIGHELQVVLELAAAHGTDDLCFLFLVADAAEVDAGVPEPALELVEAASIAEVRAGHHQYVLTLDLPEDELVAGEYYLIAVVDPLDAVAERDETNNAVESDEIARVGARLTLGDASMGLADLVLEEIVPDDRLVDLDVTPLLHPPADGMPDHPNHHLGVSAKIRTSGPDELFNVAILCQLEVPGAGLFALEIWNSVLQGYVGTITLDVVNAAEPTMVHLDLRLSQSSLDILAGLLPPEPGAILLDGKVRVILDPFNVVPEFDPGIVLHGDEDGQENAENVTLLLRLFDEEEPIQGRFGGDQPFTWESPFVKDFTNGNVGVGVRFGATAALGTHGIRAEAEASIPATLVGQSVDLLNLAAVGQYNPLHKSDNGFVVTLKALNITVYEKRTKEDEALAPSPLTLMREQAFSTTFVVGPVPMFARVGARGSLGMEVNAFVGSTFHVEAEPFLDFAVFGEGGPGASYLGWTLGGGIGAELQLIEERFHAGFTAGLLYDSGTSLMTGLITEEVTNHIAGPNGKVFLFLEATGKILWKTITKRWEYVLATWQSFVKDDTLFHQTQSLSVHIP